MDSAKCTEDASGYFKFGSTHKKLDTALKQ